MLEVVIIGGDWGLLQGLRYEWNGLGDWEWKLGRILRSC